MLDVSDKAKAPFYGSDGVTYGNDYCAENAGFLAGFVFKVDIKIKIIR